MPVRTNHIQATKPDDRIAIAFVTASQFDVRSAARHICGNRDRSQGTGFGHNFSFIVVVRRVQNSAFHTMLA